MAKPIHKRLKSGLMMDWVPEYKWLRIYGDNKDIAGEIFIHPKYLLSIAVMIRRIWTQKK